MAATLSTLKKSLESSYEYGKFFTVELYSYINYVNTLIIGAIINLITGNGFPGKLTPYIVPLIVQSLSKSAIKFKNRHMEQLLQLPSEREDPVFIMNKNGDIILSTGLTFEIFKSHSVSNISQIIGRSGYDYMTNCMEDDFTNNKKIELYSELFNKFYEIKIKSIYTGVMKNEMVYLIWFTDITEQKNHEARLSNMLIFSGIILSSLPRIIDRYGMYDLYDMLAEFVLTNEYSGVFITRMDSKGNLSGYVFKQEDNRIEKSELITIASDSSAPVRRSREKSSIVVGDISVYQSRVEFEKEYPFDDRVKSFLDFPIDNFINYHEVNVSVIAFNKNGVISKYDRMLIEIIVNNIKTVLGLVEYISKYNQAEEETIPVSNKDGRHETEQAEDDLK